MCFATGGPQPYGDPVGPPGAKKYAEQWMVNQVIADRQARRLKTTPRDVPRGKPIEDDEDDEWVKTLLGD